MPIAAIKESQLTFPKTLTFFIEASFPRFWILCFSFLDICHRVLLDKVCGAYEWWRRRCWGWHFPSSRCQFPVQLLLQQIHLVCARHRARRHHSSHHFSPSLLVQEDPDCHRANWGSQQSSWRDALNFIFSNCAIFCSVLGIALVFISRNVLGNIRRVRIFKLTWTV